MSSAKGLQKKERGSYPLKRPQVILVCALLLFAGAHVRADLVAPQPPTVPPPAQRADRTSPAAFDELGVLGFGDGLPARALSAEGQPAPQAQVLPGAPSSLALFLSAMGSLGLWQLGRSARRMHLSHAPAWFHTGGPAQIGHSTPIDPDLTPGLPACCFDQPAERPRVDFTRHIERDALFKSQILLSVEPIRGPPPVS